jgi:transposase
MNRKYDDEFKRQAIKKVFDGQSVASVSRELGVNEGLLHKCKRATLENGDGHRTGAQLSETAALKKRIRELEMENEILKKAAHIFGRGS